MTRKTADSYLALFQFIEEKLFLLQPTEFMTDFEEGMRLAIQKHWPNVRRGTCWFHFKRAVNKRCRSLGMMKLFRKKKDGQANKKYADKSPAIARKAFSGRL